MVETTWLVLIICAVPVFGLGVVAGLFIHYLFVYKPFRDRYFTLSDQMVNMKKQGFVRQYEVEQRRDYDPAEDVVEY